MYRAWGGDLINMSVLPEAKLAREAEVRCVKFHLTVISLCGLILNFRFSYALIATATDYDSWRPHEGAVTAAEVFKTLKANADTSRHVAAVVLEELAAEISSQGATPELLSEEVGGMKFAIMPRPGEMDPGDKAKLAYILPDHFATGSA